jgi:hypothetical protein
VDVLTSKADPFYGIYFVCSKSTNCWVDLGPAKTDFEYEPRDSAETFVKKLPDNLQQQIKLFGKTFSRKNIANEHHASSLSMNLK